MTSPATYITPFIRFPLFWSFDEQKKKASLPKGWTTMTNYEAYQTLEQQHTGYALLCGRELNGRRIVVIDIDSFKASEKKVVIKPEFIKLCEKSSLVESTPNGRHYYFTLSDEQHLLPSQTNIVWNGERMKFIDFLSKDKVCFCSPSTYMIDKKVCTYKILRGTWDEIAPLPKEIYEGLLPKEARDESEDPQLDMSDDLLQFVSSALDLLPAKCAKEFDTWKRIGMWIKKIIPGEAGYELWNTFSRRAESKYDINSTFDLWRTAPEINTIGLGTILYYIKKYNDKEAFADILTLRDKLCDKVKYQTAKQQFEEIHFYCMDTQDICSYEDGVLTHFHIAGANYTFAEYNYYEDDKLVQFIPKWLSSSDKRIYKGIISTPLSTPKGYLNLFTGFKGQHAEGYNKLGLERFLYLVLLLANNNDISYKYILQWFAKLIQKPAEIPRTCMIFVGEEGSGKDTVIDFIGSKLIGTEMYSIIQDAEKQLYDTHSTVLVNTFLHKLEEASAVDNRKHADKLKTLISQTESIVNEKNVKKFKIKVYPHFVMTTNNTSPVKISDTDRRFFINWVSSARINVAGNQTEFWDETYRLLDEESTIASIWKHLMEYDISDMPYPPPKTEYYQDLKLQDEDTVDSWIKSIEELEDTTSTDAFRIYKHWCTENDKPYVKNLIAFGKTLAVGIQKGIIHKRKSNGTILYNKSLPLMTGNT